MNILYKGETRLMPEEKWITIGNLLLSLTKGSRRWCLHFSSYTLARGCVVPVHIGRQNWPDKLFCVVLVTFGRGCLSVARLFSPALRPTNNFADNKTPKTSTMELKRRMYNCFSSFLLFMRMVTVERSRKLKTVLLRRGASSIGFGYILFQFSSGNLGA